MTPFECVYGMNPLTPLDLTLFPCELVNRLDGNIRAEAMNKIHEKVRLKLEKKNQEVAIRVNKGRRRLVLEPRKWVWVHLRKERFPNQRKAKIIPREDGLFQVLKRINDNAYQIDLPSDYQVHSTFNNFYLSPVDILDVHEATNLRTNSLQDGEDDTSVKSRPFTRIQDKELQQFQSLFMHLKACESVMHPTKEGYLMGVELLIEALDDVEACGSLLKVPDVVHTPGSDSSWLSACRG
ncbi:uncharacterized protein LOC124899496 [Capsicum annuum]|uniref:uncharacterized protein LOC124899496 n=1 Tax=Capsicum annuum TaxID=4072 RepID=UPI001FB0A91F|nr:uncharacterized protein LOC124899496 [Capsicum annuum]